MGGSLNFNYCITSTIVSKADYLISLFREFMRIHVSSTAHGTDNQTKLMSISDLRSNINIPTGMYHSLKPAKMSIV